MKFRWLAAGILASASLVGCASTNSGCRVPSYVVPPPVPPLRIPSGLSKPIDHSRYPETQTPLVGTTSRPAPGTGREAVPPTDEVTPESSQTPSDPTTVPSDLAGTAHSPTKKDAESGTSGTTPSLLAAPAPSPQS